MTDEQINEAIALIQGWGMDPEEAHEWKSRGRWVKSPLGEMKFRHTIPNYCNDLNAMHEAIMTRRTERDFVRENCAELRKVVCEPEWALFAFDNATARQRAEAFLRTLSRWEES
jgi:hypothetical protein